MKIRKFNIFMLVIPAVLVGLFYCWWKNQFLISVGASGDADFHLFYQGGESSWGSFFFLDKDVACVWGVELAAQVENTDQWYGCAPGAPDIEDLVVRVNGFVVPNVPVAHPWSCNRGRKSNLSLSPEVLGCPPTKAM